MGLKERLARFGARAPIPVFLVAGAAGSESLDRLRMDDRVAPVTTPRAAAVLVGAGAIPEVLVEMVLRLHDTLPHPRTIAWLVTPEGVGAPDIPGLTLIGPPHADRIVALGQDLLSGRRPSDVALLPDQDPAPWRGVGPYGQGGSGMTGGVPYGRPMAGLAPDRDGLRLDRLPVTLGPWFPYLPAGLRLRLGFSGDVLSEVEAIPPDRVLDWSGGDPFDRVLHEPVSVHDLELARVRSHLRALAVAVDAAGLEALAGRMCRLAASEPLDSTQIDSLEHRLLWTGFFRWPTGGVGKLPADAFREGGLGPIGRAAGILEDARTGIQAYLDLGFRPIMDDAGDAAARWRVQIAEMRQSLILAARSSRLTVGPLDAFEGPRGLMTVERHPLDAVLATLSVALEGLEWGDALTTLVSLDLGPEAFAARGGAMTVAA